MNIRDEILNVIKKYNITASELKDDNLSVSQISRMKNNLTTLKEKHYPVYINSINRVLKKRGFNKKISFDSTFFNSIINKNKLETIIEEAIINRNIFEESKINEIIEFGKKHEFHSLKFRFLLANHYKNTGNENKALVLFRDIFNNFDNEIYHKAILINLAILSKDEEAEFFYNKNKELIEIQNDKIKIIIYYHLALKYLRLGFYTKAKEHLLKIINYGLLNDYYFKAYDKLGTCFFNLKSYKLSIHHFTMGISDVRSEKEIIKGLSKTLPNYCKMNNIKELNKTIDKILTLKENINEKVYRVDYEIAKSYAYLNNKPKFIEYLEKEVFYENDYSSKEFDSSAYFHSVKSLMFLYGKDINKQKKLINSFINYPSKYLTLKKIMYLLKYYDSNNLTECLSLLVNKVQIEFTRLKKR